MCNVVYIFNDYFRPIIVDQNIGLDVNRMGVGQLVAVATVYNLNKASDFAGTFTTVSTGMEVTGQAKFAIIKCPC